MRSGVSNPELTGHAEKVKAYMAITSISNGCKPPLAPSAYSFLFFVAPPCRSCVACGYLAFINWLPYIDKNTFVCHIIGAGVRVCLFDLFCFIFPSHFAGLLYLTYSPALCTEIITGSILDGCARSATFIICLLFSLSLSLRLFLLICFFRNSSKRARVFSFIFFRRSNSFVYCIHNFR